MRHLNYYDKEFNKKIEETTPTIALKMIEGSESEFGVFLETEFIEMFEEIIWSTTFSLIKEEVNVKKWLGDKWNQMKSKISSFLQKIGQSLKDSIVGKLMNTLKEKVKSIEKECLLFFDDLKMAVIKNELILPGNKVNFKKITEMVMGIFKEEKKNIEPTVLKNIENNVGSIELKESLKYGFSSTNSVESLLILENDIFYNHITDSEIFNENLWSALKKGYNKLTTTGKEVEDSKVTTQKGEIEVDDQNIITFGVDGVEGGKNIKEETIKDSSVGIFGKLLTKLGVSSPRAQVALSKLSFILIPVIISLVIGIFSATGGVTLAAGAAGGVFLAPAFSIFTVVCGLFFCLGVFLIMCWFRKPYPDLKDYIQYLEAWFEVYPSGRRSKEDEDREQKIKNLSSPGGKEGFAKFDDARLKKDDKCALLGKLNAIDRKKNKSDEDLENMEKVEKFLAERGIKPDSYEEERENCREKREKSEEERKNTKRLVSYKSDDGKYQSGVATGKSSKN